jgi:hypothetical protein
MTLRLIARRSNGLTADMQILLMARRSRLFSPYPPLPRASFFPPLNGNPFSTLRSYRLLYARD